MNVRVQCKDSLYERDSFHALFMILSKIMIKVLNSNRVQKLKIITKNWVKILISIKIFKNHAILGKGYRKT